MTMTCGVKFCGGCNPRYQRNEALEYIKSHFDGKVDFINATEGKEHDMLLVLGGCSNCCAKYDQYKAKKAPMVMWDKDHINKIIEDIKKEVE